MTTKAMLNDDVEKASSSGLESAPADFGALALSL